MKVLWGTDKGVRWDSLDTDHRPSEIIKIGSLYADLRKANFQIVNEKNRSIYKFENGLPQVRKFEFL